MVPTATFINRLNQVSPDQRYGTSQREDFPDSWATSKCDVLWPLQHHSPGHIRYGTSKTMGDRLIVAVQGDQMLTIQEPHHCSRQALGLAWLLVVDDVLIHDKVISQMQLNCYTEVSCIR